MASVRTPGPGRSGGLAGMLLAAALAAGPAVAGHPGQGDAGAPAQHGTDAHVMHAPDQAWDADAALRYSQAAIGREVRDAALTDQDGRPLRLADYRGRPLVLSLVYTSCHHVCPLITTTLARAVAAGREALGEESFAVLTVGFDSAHDTPERLRSFAAGRGIDTARWPFAGADAATVAALAADIGFIFHPTAKGYDHLAQTTVIDAEGRVYRQVYGDAIDPPALVEPLKELVWNRPGTAPGLSGWLRGIKLFCTVYDARAGRYRFDYSVLAMALAGILSLSATLAFVIHAWRGGTPRAG